LQPAAFFFSTGGVPDGRVATISEPSNTHNNHVEFESADDFVLNTETVIDRASFTGLLTGGATPAGVNKVILEIYRVFPNDSDLNRTPKVPTRINSPADNEILDFDSAVGDLKFSAHVLNPSFTAQHSVSSADKISVNSGGNGPATGEEVQFDVAFNTQLDLPAGHYFFVPKVGLNDNAPAGADFLYLSAPRPIAASGTPFSPDLQSWMRFSPGLAPDWLRIGTDIIGGTTFNGTFSLSGHTVTPAALSKLSALDSPKGVPNPFPETESAPAINASVSQGLLFPEITLSGRVTDRELEDHRVQISWGDGKAQELTLAANSDGHFSVSHTFARTGPVHHDTIIVTALDDQGVASAPLTFDVIV
jgi:hypothetical protein